MRFRLLLCAALVCLGTWSTTAAAQERFELKDGDRVVFLGNTLIEREQKYGYWELMLTMAWPERNVTFRNLGWSGDTVWGESRAGFGSQRDGFKKLVDEVNAAKPTVIFVGYGNVEAFDGEKGLPKFVEGFGKLLDELEKTKARIVVLGPKTLRATTPSREKEPESRRKAIESYNRDGERYAQELKAVSEKRGHRFVDLLAVTKPQKESPLQSGGLEPVAMTDNGIDTNDHGYLALAWTIAKTLQVPREVLGFANYELQAYRYYLDLGRRFDREEAEAKIRQLEEKPLVRIGHETIETIRKKNELFFHRWRPQNETYLFGFRKHEQGKNAAEVFQFDPLVEAEEKKIAELRVKLAAEMKTNGGAK